MRKWWFAGLALLGLLVGCRPLELATVTPMAEVEETATPTPLPTVTMAATAEATQTARATHTAVIGEMATPSQTSQAATATLRPTFTPTPTATAGPTPTSILEGLPGESRLEVANQMGGVARGMSIVGERAYLAVGPRILVLDVHDPAAPVQVGQSNILDSVIMAMAVDSGIAYVLAQNHRLYFFDLTDEDAPQLLNSMEVSETADRLAVHNGMVYLVGGEEGFVNQVEEYGRLFIIDATNPESPTEMGHLNMPLYVQGMVVVEGYVYLLTRAQLQIINVSSPLEPIWVGSMEGDAWGNGGQVVGNRLYLANRQLTVLNISDPERPEVLTTLQRGLMEAGTAVAVEGDFVYAVIAGCDVYCSFSLGLINAADLANPILERGRGRRGEAEHIAYVEGFVYVLVENGLFIFDTTRPPVEQPVVEIKTMGDVRAMAVPGPELYTASTQSIDVLDANQPTALTYQGEIPFLHWDGFVAYDSHFLYVNDELLGYITVYDVFRGEERRGNLYWSSLLPNMTGAGEIPDVSPMFKNSHFYGVSGSTLYVSNMTDPTAPRIVFQLEAENGHNWFDIYVADNRVYLAEEQGIRILEGANPAELVEVGFAALPESAGLFGAAGDYAYARASSCVNQACVYTLYVIDISNPAQAQLVATMDIAAETSYHHSLIIGNHLYLAAGDVSTIDISDPTQPYQLDHLVTPGKAWYLALVGDTLYVADGEAGLLILQPAE